MGYLEGEGCFTVTCNGERYVCNPDNTTAYVHDPRFKDADHIFRYTYEPDEEEEMAEGIFIFRALFGVVFNPLVESMEEEGFTVIHHEEPSDLDWAQYVSFTNNDIDKYWEVLDGTE